MSSSSKVKLYNIGIFFWLLTLTVMTFLLILIGGLTRLTDSGLSMVDWRPILGTIPPLNIEDWESAFNEYKAYPEYQLINKSMDLNEFKYIFWWEWFHRFFARCIGLIFIIPMLIFVFQKKISIRLFYSLLILLAFGIMQALVGWWMVKSGLDINPHVSAYRLAFHLTNAVIILSILFWLTLNSLSPTKSNFLPKNNIEYFIILIIFLIFITIISGAFMAGTNSGQSFNTYPLMNGNLIPNDYFLIEMGIKNFFENTVAINFNHRWLASLTFVLIIIFLIYLYWRDKFKNFRYQMVLIFIFVCLQFFLGIFTLLSNVQIALASLHQINSMLLLASILLFYHSIKKL